MNVRKFLAAHPSVIGLTLVIVMFLVFIIGTLIMKGSLR
jgi:hypothetical protein